MSIQGSFDLAATLECGQCFRWEALPGGQYWFAAEGKQGLFSQDGALSLLSEDPYWHRYFDLDRDYDIIRRELCEREPLLKEMSAYAPGIRILQQEPWEALCCFILSQNNNIPRIKGIVHRLCKEFGETKGISLLPEKEEISFYSFPSAKRLAACSLEELSPLRSGFRARYLIDAAERVASKKEGLVLSDLYTLPVSEAREALMKILGVGRKVADCTLLFGFHRLEVFPVDVWIRRAMETFFPGKDPEDLGPYAGIAQQYIFHYCRSKGQELFPEKARQKKGEHPC